MEYLEHHGVLGMKWGVRRYQNPDGSLTEAGKKRFYKNLVKVKKEKDSKGFERLDKESENIISKEVKKYKKVFDEENKSRKELDEVEDFNKFKSNKKEIQKYILEAYDRGFPFDDTILKDKIYEINGDVTKSLLDLHKHTAAIDIAYNEYLSSSKVKEAQEKWLKASDQRIKSQEKIVEALLGSNKDKPVREVAYRYKNPGQKFYRKAYSTASDEVWSEINRQINVDRGIYELGDRLKR